MDKQQSGRNLAIAVAVIIILAIAYVYLKTPDNRTATDRLGDAIHDLPNGVNKSAEDLQDRTPGQKIGDKIKDWTAPSSNQ